MSVFAHYARYYDLLYRDKPYLEEAAGVLGQIQARRPGARDLLNLGCGTGRHDRALADLGCRVTGVDLSAEMLERARRAAGGREGLDYLQGDARTVRAGRTFDAVVSLFHVVSYQTENDDLLGLFRTARAHLTEGGVFLFDCWYGPGVLSEPPTDRERVLEDDVIRVVRTAHPVVHPSRDVVDVHYRIAVRERVSGAEALFEERHPMRYLFLPEVEAFLGWTGLRLVDAHESFRPGVAPSLRSWNVTVVAVAVADPGKGQP
jgi:SAM-dependent methyltransferase